MAGHGRIVRQGGAFFRLVSLALDRAQLPFQPSDLGYIIESTLTDEIPANSSTQVFIQPGGEAVLAQHETQDDVDWLLREMQTSGAIDRAFNFSQSLAGAAIHEFNKMFESVPDSRDKRFILDLITWTFRRKR